RLNDRLGATSDNHHPQRIDHLSTRFYRTRYEIDCALRILPRELDARAGLERRMDVEQWRMRPDRGTQPERLPREEPQPEAAVLVHRQIVALVMRKAGRRLLVFLRQGDPRLNAVQRSPFAARPLKAFRVSDAAPGRHP